MVRTLHMKTTRTEGDDMNDVLLRDLFAAAAIAGELASQDECTGMYRAPFERLAHKAYNIADAMMAERKKRLETT